jgi:hypothetical protein
MKKASQYILVLLVFYPAFASTVYADNLGRLFTSYEDRQKLEQIRNKKERIEEVEIKQVEVIEEPVAIKTEIIVRDPVSIKGIVHRSDGKNAAWINDSNTFEGDLDSQLILVPGNKIKPDQVTVIMPDDNTQVELKVGDVFIPEPIEKEVTEFSAANTD